MKRFGDSIAMLVVALLGGLDMQKRIQLLDCTLRDGSYINGFHFGAPAIKGIIKKMQEADVDLIECGWLKDAPHEEGSAYYHVPADLKPYLLDRSDRFVYVAMIDWDRYDVSALPPYDGTSINAVRVVFPRGITFVTPSIFADNDKNMKYYNKNSENGGEALNKVFACGLFALSRSDGCLSAA